MLTRMGSRRTKFARPPHGQRARLDAIVRRAAEQISDSTAVAESPQGVGSVCDLGSASFALPPFRPATLHTLRTVGFAPRPTAYRSSSTTPLLHYSITPSLHHSITPSLHHSITPSLHHSITPSLHYSITPSLHHSITPSLHHSITPSLHHSITPSLHHSITPSLHHSITPSP